MDTPSNDLSDYNGKYFKRNTKRDLTYFSVDTPRDRYPHVILHMTTNCSDGVYGPCVDRARIQYFNPGWTTSPNPDASFNLPIDLGGKGPWLQTDLPDILIIQNGTLTVPSTIQGGGRRPTGRTPKPHVSAKASTKWLPTSRTVTLKGTVRKLWRSAKDASVTAVKRIVKAADGSKKVRFQRV